MNSTLSTIFGLLGGLAIFIYGMNLMSEGLQKAAGAKMKYVLGILTKNPIIGILAGAVTTAVLQSSSATTVMVIGFVSAGLMTLPQAISVIFGANIGTTMTAQIIAFNLSEYIWPIIFIGFIVFFFAKKEGIKSIGQSIFAFGLLFLGIETMGSVMKPLAGSPVFVELMAKVSDVPIFGVLLGTGMTVVVQSSSATIAVLQNFAQQPMADGVTSVIGLAGAIPILLGDNIGTTITALLASVGQSKDAKRTAVAHSVFNITGSVIFLCILPYFVKLVEFVSPKGPEIEVISRQIANGHTMFNLINTFLFLPFIWLLVKVVCFIVPDKKEDMNEEVKPLLFDEKLKAQPVFALNLAAKEIVRVTGLVAKLLENTKEAVLYGDVATITKVREGAIKAKENYKHIETYMSNLFSAGVLTEQQALSANGLMYMVNDLTKISYRCNDLMDAASEKVEKHYGFSEEAMGEIETSFATVESMLSNVTGALESGVTDSAKKVLDEKETIATLERRLRKNHKKRVKKGKCSPEFTVVFTNILGGIERIGEHCTNVADAILYDIDLDTFNIQLEAEQK